MAFELGLYLSIAVAGWLCLGPLLGRHSDAGTRSLSIFGLIGVVWAIGELIALDAEDVSQLVFARLSFFLGAAALAPAWFAIGVRCAMPEWYRCRPWLLALAFVVPAFYYSSLYWDDAGRFVVIASTELEYGPWYDGYMFYQYALSGVGTVYFVSAARRLGHVNPTVMSALVAGVLLPLGVYLAYYVGLLASDWTAATIGPAGVFIWIAIVDSGLCSNLPIDRNEVIEQLDVGVVVSDLDGRIVSVNAAAERLTEQPGLRGRLLPEAVAAAEQRPDAVIESSGIALRGRFGIVGHALILTDRTEAEATRRRLELGGRLEALGSLTAGIAHEVNNPLAYIQANLASLATTAKSLSAPEIRRGLEGTLGEAVDEMAGIIEETHEGFERIRELVERLRNFSRSPDLSAGAAPIDLEESVRRAASVATIGRKGEPIKIEGGDSMRVLSLENAVFQVLVNLLLNAVQATPDDAGICVQIEPAHDGVAVRVKDSGPGIPESLLPRIFDPFFTTKPSGTGLGLSLSYDLVQQLGGELEAWNDEEGGAVFQLWLPRVMPMDEDTPSEDEIPAASAVEIASVA